MNFTVLFGQGDTASQAVTGLLFGMSVASWVVIAWKMWLLQRAGGDVRRCVAAFWQSPTVEDARARVGVLDREQLLVPLLRATDADLRESLAARAGVRQRVTRQLRDALSLSLRRLRQGQVLLASIGATAPFVGLLGTVWGIHHALAAIANAGQITIERVAGPVGEALVMTAAGLAVAIPAVLAYNVFGRMIGDIEAQLDGFAHDLSTWTVEQQAR